VLPDQIRLLHIREAALKAIAFADGRTRGDLDSDEMLTLALTKLVEIIGEAAKNVSEASRATLPDFDWRAAARMRDRLTHHYFDINRDILWSTVMNDLPSVLEALSKD
jgi:uncharacterized protein with HEPN domain